ncbi:MAG TPA: 4-vinyl reductase [Sandaracinaceae bacterium LLY-WYZ-13_1]|nr:4-vinyl reductase [Sandaracinaceae bacterium LLY-WYZ-13_1]
MPGPLEPPFEKAEQYVEKLFGQVDRRPQDGTIHVGEDRYVFMRCESLYLTWFDAMAETFGAVAARDFIYNTAREIGRSDCASFSDRLGVTDGVERLSCGPVHFAHAGWALVEIHDDSAPATDDSYFLHYDHPNTFESEVALSRDRRMDTCACHFSAGYSAGWCSEAFGIEVHGREIRCLVRGDDRCEFIMAPSAELDAHQARLVG